MFWRRTAIAALLVAVTAAPAHAWYPRTLFGWRNANWRQYNAAGQLGGGQIVGGVQFIAVPQGAMMSAAQWQLMVSSSQQQTPALTAAQWQQLAASQVRPPASTLPKSLQPAINPFATGQPSKPQPAPPPAPGADG